MAQINYDDLPKIREKHKNQKMVFCSGSFNLPHAGHVIFLEDCKKLGDILIVGVGGNEAIKQNRGHELQFLNEHVRVKIISSLKPVDYCLIDDNSHKEHIHSFVEYVFKNLRPDVYVVNQDAFEISLRQKLADKYGIKMVILERWAPKEFEEISATKIIEKIRGRK